MTKNVELQECKLHKVNLHKCNGKNLKGARK